VDLEETSATELCAGCAVGTSFPTLMEWRTRARSFASVEAYEEARRVIRVAGTPGASHLSDGPADPERVAGGIVSAGLFASLGIQPALGRAFTAEDDRAGADPVVLLSDTLWKRRFAGDPRALGAILKVDGVDHTVVGVMPAGFRFPEFAQFWTPLAPERHGQQRSERSLGVIARLRTYSGLSGMQRKIERLLDEFEFSTMSTAYPCQPVGKTPVLAAGS